MYQVLARQYRPRNFNQLVGQNHVSRALTSALERGRLHHAYLFTGTRGVGKTTIARILAKCLNCETGVTATPCEQCATCKAVNDGRFIDLIEIDAASRTKVEDTRELLDNVPYAPTQGRYKVYLIDEVHMLSTHSFNALLKTLEEPPAHVKFLFATTDPQKLPITVISRCLQFTLRPLTLDEIRQHLTQILTTEQIAFEDDALWQISEAAQGSVRDALSLTDQAIAYGQGEIKHQDVKEMLGLIDRQMIYDLILAIHQNQQQQVAQLLLQFRQQALDVSLVLDQLIATLHELAMMQFLPELSLRYSHEINEKIQRLASCVSPQDLQLYYQIACKGRADLQIAVTQEQGFEMTVLRLLAFRPLAVHELPQLSTQSSVEATANVDGAADLAQHTQSNAQPTTQVEAQSQQILQSVQNSTTQTFEGGEGQHNALVQENINPEHETKTPETKTIEAKTNTIEANTAEAKTPETQIAETTVELNSPEVSSIALVDPVPIELVQDVDVQKIDVQEAALVDPVQIDAAQTPSLTYFDVQIDQQMQVEGGLLPDQAAVNLAQMADQDVFFLNPHQNDGDVSNPHPSQASQALTAQALDGKASQVIAKDTAQQHSLNQNSPQQANPTVAQHNQLGTSVGQIMPQDILRLQPVALEGDWDVHKWEFWFRSSGLSPAVQELAQQGVMHGQINGVSVFHISQDYQNLLVSTQQDLQQALTQQWPDTRFSLQYDQLTELSPYQLQKQRKQQAYDCATALLQQEPVIQQLSNVFNATLSDIQLK